jgi:DNA topoisomerase I
MGWKTMVHNGIYTFPKYQNNHNPTFAYNNRIYSMNTSLQEAFALYTKVKNKDMVTNRNFLKSIADFLPQECRQASSLKELKFSLNSIASSTRCKPKLSKYSVVINGKPEKLDRACADPAYIFVGRGNHALRGTYKPAVTQSEITLNCSKSCVVPGKWKALVCNKSVAWVACWKDTLFQKYKYIYPHSSSSMKKTGAIQKFDFARKINKKLSYVRKVYMRDVESEDNQRKQHAIACYLIDKLLIRCGTETDDYDTFGCTTLECKHVRLNGSKLLFNFKSKDSIMFSKTLVCQHPRILQYFQKAQKNSITKSLFPDISGSSLNGYLNTIVQNLTAKVFRTCHASSLLEKHLKKAKTLVDFKEANGRVASACNHTNLNTSKGNYIDPRIIVAFSKKNDINISKLFSPVLIEKYEWALGTGKDFLF